MKIAINTTSLSEGHKTRGIGYYTQNLINNLKINPEIQLQEFSNMKDIKSVDIIHYPTFDFFRRTLKMGNNPTIVTIHDLIPIIFPKNYPPGLKGKVNFVFQSRQLKKAEAIITDSESSKKDIINYLQFPPDKIYSIPLASTEDFKQIKDKSELAKIKQKFNLPDKFAIYLGNVNWNKNLINLSQACINAKLDLVLVGSGFDQKENLNHPELKSFRDFLDKFSDNPLIHILGYLPTEELVKVINLASIGLLPSFYEGFGLPILQFQACGVPVITANISSMPEVAGEGAVFVDPYDKDAISNAITDIIDNEVYNKSLIKKGLENIKRFSWEKVANETIKVYKFVQKN